MAHEIMHHLCLDVFEKGQAIFSQSFEDEMEVIGHDGISKNLASSPDSRDRYHVVDE